MTTTLDNRVCVKVSTDFDGYKFMDVTLPNHAEVSISTQGVVHVNVNEMCVFRLCRAGGLTIRNELASPKNRETFIAKGTIQQ